MTTLIPVSDVVAKTIDGEQVAVLMPMDALIYLRMVVGGSRSETLADCLKRSSLYRTSNASLSGRYREKYGAYEIKHDYYLEVVKSKLFNLLCNALDGLAVDGKYPSGEYFKLCTPEEIGGA